jgi:hypothetical protein
LALWKACSAVCWRYVALQGSTTSYFTDIFVSTKDIYRDFERGEVCKTFTGKRIKGSGDDVWQILLLGR